MAVHVESIAVGQPRVAVAFHSKIDLLAGILGVLRTGRSVVLLNAGLSSDVLRVNLQDTAVQSVLHDGSVSQLSVIDNLAPPVLSVTDSGDHSVVTSIVQRSPDDEWGVLFSSGTTGVPKGIERSHESMVTEFIGWCLELGLTRATRFYIGRPIYYTGGLVLALATLLVGGTTVLNDYERDDSFDESWRDFQETLSESVIDHAFFIPDQLRRFLKLHAAADLTAQTILTMGAPITGAEKQAIATRFGCKVVESWGNSESLGTITDPEDVDLRPDSIGRPFLTDEMWVVNDEYRPVPAHELGRLAGSETAGFLKYSNRPQETELAKHNEMIISEDIGYVDEQGFFYVRGRSQDCVTLSDGSTIFVQSVERQLRGLPNIQDCCVLVGSPDGMVKFYVALVPTKNSNVPMSFDEMRQQLDERIASNVEFRVYETLPRLPAGKIDRTAILKTFDSTTS